MIVRCSSCSQLNRLPAKRLLDKAHCAACKARLLPANAPIAVATKEDFDELVRDSPAPVLVDFWADWCPPCRTVAPELDKIATKRRGEVVVAKVDTEALPQVAQRFHVRSIPTMILFKGGSEDKRLSGAMNAAGIEEHLSIGGV